VLIFGGVEFLKWGGWAMGWEIFEIKVYEI
jgi:hypothetical protein